MKLQLTASISRSRISRTLAVGAVLCLFVTAGAGTASATARVLWVANYGVDGPACGARAKPCRSISRAIALANNGDTIDVGAGNYGDLNQNGRVDPGDELFGEEESCTVCVAKSVAIYSLHGPNVTAITAASKLAVYLKVSGIRFGAKDHGFTVKGGPESGIAVNDPAGNITIAGNVVVGGRLNYGILAFSRGSSLHISDNRVFAGDIGFEIGVGKDSVIERNIVQNVPAIGFRIYGGSNVTVRDNKAVHVGYERFIGFLYGVGFYVTGSNLTLEGNTAADNAGRGWNIGEPTGPTTTVRSFAHNSMVGNGGPGVVINAQASVQNFQFSNIYGNNGRILEATGEAVQNCGLANDTGGTIKATNNFWGSTRGPGADPADNAGTGCDSAGSNTIFKPVATAFQ